MVVLQDIFTFLVGVFWACLFCVRALASLVSVGPSQYFCTNKKAQRPSELDDEKYGEHRIIDLRGVKFHYVISGQENAPLMLMLHGFPEIWYSWRHQIIEFKKDFRVVAVDMRGFGDSDRPQGLENYKLSLLVEDVRALVNGLGYESCVLLAHDWGGAVAWAFAYKYSHMVDRLVIMNMCPAPIWWKTAVSNIKQFVCSGYIFFFFLPFLPEYLMSKNDFNIFHQMLNERPVGLKSGPVSEDVLECYKYYYRRPNSLSSGINYYRANLKPPGVLHPVKYSLPVQIVWGTRDPFLSRKLLDETIKSIDDLTLTLVENSSHWVQMDRPEIVNKAVREFLQSSHHNLQSTS